MASELLSSVTGGGGGFITKFDSGGLAVGAGATGIYATITPPGGQRVQLTELLSQTTRQTNATTITVNGVTVAGPLNVGTSTNGYTVSGTITIGGGPNGHRITGGVDEVIELSTNIATSHTTFYSYQFGV